MFDVLGVKNIERGCVFQIVTPCYIDMELKTGGLEDDFQFQLGDFLGSIAIFRGATFFSDPFFCSWLRDRSPWTNMGQRL